MTMADSCDSNSEGGTMVNNMIFVVNTAKNEDLKQGLRAPFHRHFTKCYSPPQATKILGTYFIIMNNLYIVYHCITSSYSQTNGTINFIFDFLSFDLLMFNSSRYFKQFFANILNNTFIF